MAHSEASPSKAPGWIGCSLYLQMHRQYAHLDPNRYTKANADGTIKHAIIEKCLRDEVDPYRFVGQQYRLGDYREDDEEMPEEWADYTYEFTEDDADTIMTALDTIALYEGTFHIEFRVDLSRWLPGQGGTLDLAIVIEHHDGWVTVIIWDNKFGRIPVTAVENDQLRLYGLGIWDNIIRPEFGKKVRKFKFHIFQPTVKGGGDDWECSLDELLEFGEKARKAFSESQKANPVANPGRKQCEWCIGAKTMKCDAYVDYNRKILTAMFDEDDDYDDLIERDEMPCLSKKGLSPEERTWIIKHGGMFKRFLERLEAAAIEDAYVGNPVPGLKLVLGRRPNRKYRNLQEAEERIVEDLGERTAYTKKLISIGQLEKLVGKRNMSEYEDLIDRGEAGYVLVEEGDAREGVKSLRDMFNED